MKERKGWTKKLGTRDECELDKSLLIFKKERKKGVDEKTMDEGRM